MATSSGTRLAWAGVLEQALAIVKSYSTGVTLRQLFYRLVARALLPNTANYYGRLSKYTAARRRTGEFPDLLDRTSRIERFTSFTDARQAREWLSRIYRHDRTLGQPVSTYLAIEKDGMSEQLEAWFGALGLPIVALGGYASQTLADSVRADIEEQNRPAVLIIATDLDPSGDDIARDFEERVEAFDHVVRIGVTPAQVKRYKLLYDPDAKAESKLRRDPRAKRFIEKYGRLYQYELDGIDPTELERLYRQAIARWWDEAAYRKVIAAEKRQRAALLHS